MKDNMKDKNHVAFVNSLRRYGYDVGNLDFVGINHRLGDKKNLKSVVKCAMSEQLVGHALKYHGFQFFSKDDVRDPSFDVVEDFHNLKFYKGSSPVFEFDFVGKHKNNFYVVEVKSSNLHSYLDSVDEVLSNARHAFRKDPYLLIFASIKPNVDLSEFYSKSIDRVSIIDMDISPKDYNWALSKYFSGRGDFNNEISDILKEL